MDELVLVIDSTARLHLGPAVRRSSAPDEYLRAASVNCSIHGPYAGREAVSARFAASWGRLHAQIVAQLRLPSFRFPRSARM